MQSHATPNVWSTTAGSRPTTGSTSMISGFDARLRLAIVAVLAWALNGVPALAAEAAVSTWNLERLMQQLAQVKTARATFVERKELRVLEAPLVSSGTLVYHAPSTVEKHTLKPHRES